MGPSDWLSQGPLPAQSNPEAAPGQLRTATTHSHTQRALQAPGQDQAQWDRRLSTGTAEDLNPGWAGRSWTAPRTESCTSLREARPGDWRAEGRETT